MNRVSIPLDKSGLGDVRRSKDVDFHETHSAHRIKPWSSANNAGSPPVCQKTTGP